MNWLRRLGRNRLLDLGAVLIALIGLARIAWRLPERAVANDFAHYYLGSRLLLDGANPYTTPLAPLYAQHGFQYEEGVPFAAYPPTFLWLLAPLALLPERVAYWIWVAGEVLSLAGILWLTRQLLGDRLSRRGLLFVGAAAVTSAAVYWHFHFSQTQLLLAWLLLAAYRWRLAGRDLWACGAVLAAVFIKMFPLALLPWFVWGQDGHWRTRCWRGLAVLAAAVALVVLTGVPLWGEFFARAQEVLPFDAKNHTFTVWLPSLMLNLRLAGSGFVMSAAEWRVWWSAAMVLGSLVIGLAYWLGIRRSLDPEAQFCLLCVAMLAGNPTSKGHYLVLLIFPMAVAAVRVAARPTVGGVAGLGALLFLLNNLDTWATPFLDRHLSLKILLNDLPLYGLLGLAWFFIAERRRPAARD